MFETLHIRKGLKFHMSERVGHIFGSYLMPLMGCDFSQIILYSQPRSELEEEWLEMTIKTRLRPEGVVEIRESNAWAGTRMMKTHITKRPRRAKIRNKKHAL